MRSFKDTLGREWNLALTTTAVMRIRDSVNYADVGEDGKASERPLDLGDVQTANQALTLFRNHYTKLVQVLGVALARQIEERKMTSDEFADGLSGDSFESAREAFEGELISFFPKRRRELLELVTAEMEKADRAAMGNAMETLAKASGLPSGKPLESSASIPESGLSDSSSLPETDAQTPTGGTPLT